MTLPVNVYDLVCVNVVGSAGTGTFTLGAAVAGFKTAVGLDGTQVSYGATDGTNSEVSKGTVGGSGTTLTRGEDSISSTNANALVSFGPGVTVSLIFSGFDFTAMLAALATIDGGTF
jgi:hypothetical protein